MNRERHPFSVTASVVSMALAWCACIAGFPAFAAEPAAEARDGTVRPIAEVIATTGPDVDQGTRAGVTGVVTFRNFRDGLRTVTVEDGTGGVWVEIVAPLSTEELNRVTVGTRLTVRGQLDRGGYAPRIMADEIEVIGEARCPNRCPRTSTGSSSVLKMGGG